MMNKIKIKLDGKQTGFGAVLFSEDYEEEFLRNKSNEIKLFKNLDLLKSWLFNNEKRFNPSDYEIFCKIEEDYLIPFDELQFVEDHYEWYSDAGYFYWIEESKVIKLIDLGYFVFEKQREMNLSKEEGIPKSKEFYKAAKNAIQELVYYPNAPYALSEVSTDEYGNICGTIKGTTAKIHICQNNRLMVMNMNRKEQGTRCIPFKSDLDKFLSLYIFTSKDISDPDIFKINDKLRLVREVILDILQQTYKDLTYLPLSYHGTIILEGDDDHGKTN